MSATLKEIINARAEDMAKHDGVSVAVVHIIGAAAQLHAELVQARDSLLGGAANPQPPAPAASPRVDDKPTRAPRVDPEAEKVEEATEETKPAPDQGKSAKAGKADADTKA